MNKSFQTEKHPQQDVIPEDGGIQVIPIQWREKMSLKAPAPSETSDDEEEDNSPHVVLEDLLPEGIPGIRMLVSDVILDVLLYMTPKFRQEMITHVSTEMNRIYRVFMKKNPDFTGQVSIYGHSLGSVICYDIASLQNSKSFTKQHTIHKSSSVEIDISDILGFEPKKSKKLQGLMEPVSQNITSEKLEFEIDHLFTVGSPVGMFLLLGGKTIKPPLQEGEEEGPNQSRLAVNALYNIYHPYDPVAHRIEPLFSLKLSSLKPMPIYYTKGGITVILF
jgi:hypothetical protein